MFKKLALIGLIGASSSAFASYDSALSMAANKNYPGAIIELKRDDFPNDFNKFKLAANNANVDAQITIAFMYLNGDGIEKDAVQAIEWFKLAAKTNNQVAEYALGYIYFSGGTVAINYEEAFKWFKLAADRGMASSQFALAEMYRNGKGVPQDFDEAIRYYKMASEQNDLRAVTEIGKMYLNGFGVSKSKVVAYSLFNYASFKGDVEANQKREELLSELKNKEVAEAQDLTKQMLGSKGIFAAIKDYGQFDNVYLRCTVCVLFTLLVLGAGIWYTFKKFKLQIALKRKTIGTNKRVAWKELYKLGVK
jgi:TPR repeat protein